MKKITINTEIILISQYNTLGKNNGYNVKPGGSVSTGWHHTEETISKIRASNIGQKRNKKIIAKMKNSQNKRIRSDKEIQNMSIKISDAAKKRKLNKFTDAIIKSIKEEYNGGIFMSILAKKYKTRNSTISKIIKNESIM